MEILTWRQIVTDLIPALPILLLCAIALMVIAADWFLPERRSFYVGCVALVGLGAVAGFLAGIFLGWAPPAASEPFVTAVRAFGRQLILDHLGLFFTLFFVLSAIAVVIVSLRTEALRGKRVGEYYGMLVLATVAMATVAASRDFVVLYLAIETISLPCYVLVGYRKGDRLSAEASLKYLLYGAVASGVMLFGMSYFYGLTGTTTIPSIFGMADTVRITTAGISTAPHVLAEQGGSTALFGIAFIFVLAGIGFKMALVPFHSWCPDAYQGAPTPITAYLAVASKAAGFAAALRILYPLFWMTETGESVPTLVERIDPWTIFWLLSAVTMTLGNLVAIWQTNMKRLLAYSSIAHAGYMAMAFTLTTRESLEAILIYFIVYLVMNMGAFFTVLFIENSTSRCDLDAYRGLIDRSPLLVVVLCIFLLSLLGIPPTAGFMAKFKLFGALIKAGTQAAIVLAVVAIVNTVISAYYYVKVIKVMIFDPCDEKDKIVTHPIDGTILIGFATTIFVLFLFWSPVQRFVERIPASSTVF